MAVEEMTSTDVISFYIDLGNLRIEIWIDGGWGVDALLGEQTRLHKDLDIIIQQKDLQKVLQLLRKRGYQNVEKNDTRLWNFVFGDHRDHEIDFHVIVFDNDGNGIYGPAENNDIYPVGSLLGIGKINGHSVRCTSPEYIVNSHMEYKLSESDFKAISALRKKSRIEFPEALYDR